MESFSSSTELTAPAGSFDSGRTSKAKLIVLLVCQLARHFFSFLFWSQRFLLIPGLSFIQWLSIIKANRSIAYAENGLGIPIDIRVLPKEFKILLPKISFKIFLQVKAYWQLNFMEINSSPRPVVLVFGSSFFNLLFHLQTNHFEQRHSHLPDFDWAP